MNETAAAAATTAPGDFCPSQADAKIEAPGFFHHAFLGGLRVGTRDFVTLAQGEKRRGSRKAFQRPSRAVRTPPL